MEFLYGVWSAIQSIVIDWDEPTMAREIARANHINKKLAVRVTGRAMYATILPKKNNSMSKLNYKTSKGYPHLKGLLDGGKEVICIIPSDYPHGNMCAFARIEYSATYPRKRIYVFAEFGFYATEEDFVEACMAKRIEFIEPNGEE